MQLPKLTLRFIATFACFIAANSHADASKINDAINQTIQPLIQKYAIPGMAVGVTVDGENYFYNYGVASKETQQKVTNQTLFEIGSISKTFVVTLATYAEITDKLSLSDSASTYLPELRGSSFDHITLLNLATHTAGGLPLQVPEHVTNNDQLMRYYQDWKPEHVASTHRTYSNPSIGMLGLIVAKKMEMPFANVMEKKLFPALGMSHSYIHVPASQMNKYAHGYTDKNAQVRVNPGVLASEAYGVKSNSADMLRYVQANMQMIELDEKWQRAITQTHTGYFKSGELIQDLIWEQYAYPATLKQLLAGNSDMMAHQTIKAAELAPPLPPQANAIINKTGSTNGFGAYVMFIPEKKIGIVMLANKKYPNEARVTAAYHIIQQLLAL